MLRLKEILAEKGITGKELAANVKVSKRDSEGRETKGSVSQNAISSIVNGTTFPKPELLSEIARVLDVDVRELFIPTKEVKQDFDFKCPNCGTELIVNKKK